MKKYLLTFVITLSLVICFFIPAKAAPDTGDLTPRLEALTKRVESLEQVIKVMPSSISQTRGMLSGRGNNTTAPFTASQSPFRIRWQATSTKDMVSALKIAVWKVGEYKVVYLIPAIVGGSQEGYGYIYMPAGQYYLDIEASPYVYWDIWVG